MRIRESYVSELLKLTLAVLLTAGCGEPVITGPTTSDGSDGGEVVDAPTPPAAPTGDIVFASRRDGNSEIYAMNADGSDLVRLTNHPAVDIRPAWSPDGDLIAFERASPGGTPDSEIYVMNADGSDPVRLTEGSQPEWSPDGGKIAFWRYREDDTFWGITTDIWVMNADGSDPRRLMTDAWYPAWSPDGATIAFATSGLIKVMDADGSNPVLLGTGTHPAWSPDGTKIAFVDDPDGDHDIYVVDPDGTNRLRLAEHPGEDLEPAWSPDGTRIAFTNGRGGDRDVYVMNADGSHPINLSDVASCGGGHPSWGPTR